MKIPTVTRVKPLEGFSLYLEFSDGRQGVVDFRPNLWGDVFEPLKKDPELFRQVRVDPVSGTIVWPNGADWSPEELYNACKSSAQAV